MLARYASRITDCGTAGKSGRCHREDSGEAARVAVWRLTRENPQRETYRVAMRGPGLFENYCSCPDFAEYLTDLQAHQALLLRLRKRYGPTFEGKEYARTRASMSLQYAEGIEIRLRLPAAPSPALRKLAGEYFDPAGLLRREHFRSFHQVIEAFRQADLKAVIYRDVLEYLDRENELAEGLDLERQLLAKLGRGNAPAPTRHSTSACSGSGLGEIPVEDGNRKIRRSSISGYRGIASAAEGVVCLAQVLQIFPATNLC